MFLAYLLLLKKEAGLEKSAQSDTVMAQFCLLIHQHMKSTTAESTSAAQYGCQWSAQ